MRTIKFLFLIIFTLSLCTSCKKFLDVQPDDQVLQEKLFETNNGVRIAVNGVYKLLSTPEMYGKNLTYGLLSAISNNYEVNNLPYQIMDAAQFNWESAPAQAVTDAIWKRSYNILANVNNIIQEVEKKDTTFFAERTNERNMVLGEMYGLRGMIHFELLRLFSPAPVTGYSGETIPYVSAYPTYQPARLNMADIFSKIEADLHQSQTLLANVDTVYLRGVIRVNIGRYRSTGSWFDLPQGEFFNFRAERMNFFAATGILARVYMYKGDYNNAEVNAKLVYDYQKKNWFQWTQAFNQGQVSDVDYVYTKRPDELMLIFHNAKNYQDYEEEINAGGFGSMYYTMNEAYISKLFEGDEDDYRKVGWYNRFNDMRYLTWARPKGSGYYPDLVRNDQGPLLPVLRFTEMYHILAEVYNRTGRTPQAITVLNDLRLRRGVKTQITAAVSSSQFMEVLIKDIVRENLTEGQAFFMFKRLNRNIFNGETDRVMTEKDWYAPLPQSEVAYQL